MCEDPIFQTVFPDLKIRRDSKAADRIGTTKGGGIRFIGVDGQQSGRGAHLLIVDDPYKGENEANSPTVREHVWNVFASNLRTRLAPGAGIICLHTRWHWDDVIGRIKSRAAKGEGPKYRDLNLPAICKDNGDPDPLGRQPGEALHPARYGVKFLADTRLEIGARRFAALYQGDPMLEEGNIFTKDDFHFYDPAKFPRKDVRFVITTDLAASTKTHADNSCIWLGAVNYLGRWFMSPDFILGKLSPTEYVEAICDMCKKHPVEEVLIESGPIGATIEPILRKRFEQRRIFSTRINIITVQRDKVTRSRASQDLLRTDMLRLPKINKVEDTVVPEHLMFDGQDGNPDDSVDTLSLLATRALTFDPPPKPENARNDSFLGYDEVGEPVDLSLYDDSRPGECDAPAPTNTSRNKHAPPPLTGRPRGKRSTAWR